MADMIMRKGKAANLKTSTAAVPLGIEYERLMRDLQMNVEERYKEDLSDKKIDMRKQKKFLIDKVTVDDSQEDQKSFVFSPGADDKFFDEPNGKPAYPITTVPHSQGLIWSD